MALSSKEQKILKAVQELQEQDTGEKMIQDLDRLFDTAVLSEEFSGFDRQRRSHLVGTYRHLRGFLLEIQL